MSANVRTLLFSCLFFVWCRSVLGKDDPENWWKKATIYQIYPRSFKDSDGDGVGDLAGIKSKVGYLKLIGVDAVWLSPMFKSPMKDFGYDISNYTEIDPLFGNLRDFTELVAEAKSRGLKITLDFVPNHTSNESVWFEKSIQKEDPYTDYYVWVDGKGPNKTQVPNNWLGVFGGSAWEWSPIRKQFYYHQFLKEQPDLNFRNPKVIEELNNVLRFWLDRGVDGFRVDAIKHLFEDPELRDEPPSNDTTARPDEWASLNHIYTASSPQILDVVAGWKRLVNEYEKKDGEHRLLMLEVGEPLNKTMTYYGNDSFPLGDAPFNFELMKIKKNSTARDIYNLIKGWYDAMPKSKWANWLLGNHDSPRVANRTDVRLIDGFNMVNLLLKGTAITYYGEEIGMVDTFISFEETQDPPGLRAGKDRYQLFSRDPERTPMQWNGRAQAGFTNGNKTWLPINPNYKTVNVHSEIMKSSSHLKTYQQLQKMRASPAGSEGEIEFPVVTDSILAFTRVAEKSRVAIFVVVNFGDKTESVDLTNKTKKCPRFGRVGAKSDGISVKSQLGVTGRKVDLSKIELPAKQGVALWFKK